MFWPAIPDTRQSGKNSVAEESFTPRVIQDCPAIFQNKMPTAETDVVVIEAEKEEFVRRRPLAAARPTDAVKSYDQES